MKHFTYLRKIPLTVILLVLSVIQVSAQCTAEAGNDTTIYRGYAPLSCVDLTATATGTAPFSFLWSNGDTNATVAVCDTATATYFVTITDSAGCTATDSVTVTVVDARCGSNNNKVLVCHRPPGNIVNVQEICIGESAVAAHLAHGCTLGPCFSPNPPPVLCSVNLGNDTSLCTNGTYTLDAGAGALSYLWSDNSTLQTLEVSSSGTYSVQTTDSAGCVATDTITVTLFPAPTASAGADTTIIPPACVDLNGAASGGTMPYTFLWSNGDTNASINVCDTVTTAYILTVTDSNGCTATDTVTVNVTPVIVFVCDSPKVQICHIPPGNPANMHTICVGAASVAAHLAHGDLLGPCANGQRIGQFGQVSSNPNPFNNEVNLQFITTENGLARLELYSATGMQVAMLFSGYAESFTPYTASLQTDNLPVGIYFARLTSAGKAPVMHKLILLRQ